MRNFIFCDIDKQPIYAGDKVTGIVVFVINNTYDSIPAVMLRLTGIELCQWSSANNQNSPNTEEKTVIESLFQLKDICIEPIPSFERKGTFGLPFSFIIPKNLPASFEEVKNGFNLTDWFLPKGESLKFPVKVDSRTGIRYELAAWIEVGDSMVSMESINDLETLRKYRYRTLDSVLSTQISLLIFEHPPDSLLTQIAVPKSCSKRFLFGKDDMKMTCRLEKYVNSMHLPISVLLEVENPTSKKVDMILFKLKKTIVYTANNSSVKRSDDYLIAKVDDLIINPGTNLKERLFWVHIPADLRVASTFNSTLISCTFCLSVELNVQNATNLSLSLPLHMVHEITKRPEEEELKDSFQDSTFAIE